MIRITTPSRLHFGLLATNAGVRQFGGAGLMIENPGLELIARPSPSVSITGAVAPAILQRADRITRSVLESMPNYPAPSVRIQILRAPPEHVGLGTGTQLSMAVAAAVLGIANTVATVEKLAELTDRGKRSAIGVRGFEQGGFLIDGGKGPKTRLAPLLSRWAFPEHWPILLIRPSLPAGLHGAIENKTIAELADIPTRSTDRLARLLLLEILPALAEEDFPTFAESLHQYNLEVGNCFAPVQGAPFAHSRLCDIVRSLRGWGVQAVGQSSWGPTLFVILPNHEAASRLCQRLDAELDIAADQVLLTRANNVGARIQPDGDH